MRTFLEISLIISQIKRTTATSQCDASVHILVCFASWRMSGVYFWKVLIWDHLFSRRELFVQEFLDCLKVMKQRLIISKIVHAVRTWAPQDLTGKVANPQHRWDYKMNLEKMECDFGCLKLHKWLDRNLFGFSTKMELMDKIKV